MALGGSIHVREFEKFCLNSFDETAVRVKDKDAKAVLDDILVAVGGSSGTAFFDEAATVTNPGVTQVLLSNTVPVSTTRTLSQFIVVCRVPGKFEIKLNGSVIGSGRTGPAHMQVIFPFNPGRNASAGDSITLEFTQITGGPIVDVEAYVMATDNT